MLAVVARCILEGGQFASLITSYGSISEFQKKIEIYLRYGGFVSQYQIMAKNKGKRNSASFNAILHGYQEHWLHQIHSRENKERSKIVYVAHEVADISGYPVFRSDLSGLGSGRNWIVRNGKTELTEGTVWIEEMMEIMTDRMWFHQRQRNSTKDGKIKIRYTRRNVKDRVTKGKNDKRERPATDLLRETIDLRPDHSRVLQYLIEQGRERELIPVLDQIRQEQKKLFEEIHPGRKIESEGEHTDSGQYHNDFWHSGMEEVEVDDHGAVVHGSRDEEVILENGEKNKIRHRHVFRSYGVGDGMASFARHKDALIESRKDARSIMGYTYRILSRNTKNTLSQNAEFPRDLRLWGGVDRFVDMKLRELDRGLCDRARSEYVSWLEAGYDLGKLGLREETLDQTKHKRRKEELERLKKVVRSVIEFILMIPGVRSALKSSDTIWKQFQEMMVMVAPTKDPDAKTNVRHQSRPTRKSKKEDLDGTERGILPDLDL